MENGEEAQEMLADGMTQVEEGDASEYGVPMREANRKIAIDTNGGQSEQDYDGRGVGTVALYDEEDAGEEEEEQEEQEERQNEEESDDNGEIGPDGMENGALEGPTADGAVGSELDEEDAEGSHSQHAGSSVADEAEDPRSWTLDEVDDQGIVDLTAGGGTIAAETSEDEAAHRENGHSEGHAEDDATPGLSRIQVFDANDLQSRFDKGDGSPSKRSPRKRPRKDKDGDCVNGDMDAKVEMLVEMGFPRAASEDALCSSGNNVALAIANLTDTRSRRGSRNR